MVEGVRDAVRHGASLQWDDSLLGSACGDGFAVREVARDPEQHLVNDKGDKMGGYPQGYDVEIHSEMGAHTAAIDIIERKWVVIDAQKKEEMIQSLARQIIETRQEILEHSRKMHPSRVHP